MKHYRRNHSGGERIKRIMFRILFVIIAAAIITFGTILVGNYLQAKVDALENDASLWDDQGENTTILFPAELGNTQYNSPNVFGVTLFLRDYASEEEAVLAVNTLAQHYDTVLMSVFDADGNLTYSSPALCKLNRLPAPEDNSALHRFGSAAAAAKARDMRLCALLAPNLVSGSIESAATCDGTLIAEMALYGVDEVLLTISDDIELTEETADALKEYILACRQVCADVCAIGLLLPADHYMNSDNTKQIQQLADAVSFLAIRFPVEADADTDEIYRYMNETITSLLGSFNVYNMRVILDGDNRQIAAKYESCKKNAIASICFDATISPEDLVFTVEDETETDVPTETAPFKDTSNPYAVVETQQTETTAPEPSADTTDNDETPWF